MVVFPVTTSFSTSQIKNPITPIFIRFGETQSHIPRFISIAWICNPIIPIFIRFGGSQSYVPQSCIQYFYIHNQITPILLDLSRIQFGISHFISSPMQPFLSWWNVTKKWNKKLKIENELILKGFNYQTWEKIVKISRILYLVFSVCSHKYRRLIKAMHYSWV